MIPIAALVVTGAATVFGQKTRTAQRSKTNPSVRESSAKSKVLTAVERSKQQDVISKRIQISVQGKQLNSLFEFAKPDRFRLFETSPDKEDRESVEIAGQRYMKSKAQWVKVRKDFYPLREQFFDLFFPAQFSPKRGDVFKIKSVSVSPAGTSEQNGTQYEKYAYNVSYSGVSADESGVVWISQETGLITLVETTGVGLAGAFTALWTYEYGKKVTIDAPLSFIEKDWIN